MREDGEDAEARRAISVRNCIFPMPVMRVAVRSGRNRNVRSSHSAQQRRPARILQAGGADGA